MKQTQRLALFLVLATLAGMVFITAALAETGTFLQCIGGCPPDSTECRDCCANTFYTNEKFSACRTTCDKTYNDCRPRCALIDKNSAKELCIVKCQLNHEKCFQNCDATKLEFSCPGWEKKK